MLHGPSSKQLLIEISSGHSAVVSSPGFATGTLKTIPVFLTIATEVVHNYIMPLLTLSLYGNSCNNDPVLQIYADQDMLLDTAVTGNIEILIEIPVAKIIRIVGIGKDLNKDTQVDESGKILNDKYLLVKDLKINNISMGIIWLQHLTVKYHNRESEFLYTGFWENGEISFTIQEPLLDWIIHQKFIQFENNQSTDINNRSGQFRFNYTPIQEKITCIKNLINDKNFNL